MKLYAVNHYEHRQACKIAGETIFALPYSTSCGFTALLLVEIRLLCTSGGAGRLIASGAIELKTGTKLNL